MKKIKNIKVEGLFGYKSIEQKLPDRGSVVFTGVNGSGKSHVLKIVYGTLTNSVNILSSVNFARAEITLEGGEIISSTPAGVLDPEEVRESLARSGSTSSLIKMGMGENGINVRPLGAGKYGSNLSSLGPNSSRGNAVYIDTDRIVPNRQDDEVRISGSLGHLGADAADIYMGAIEWYHRQSVTSIALNQSRMLSTLTTQLVEKMSDPVPRVTQLQKQYDSLVEKLEYCNSYNFLSDEELRDFEKVLEGKSGGAPSLKRVFGVIYEHQRKIVDYAVPLAERLGLLLEILNDSYRDTLKHIELQESGKLFRLDRQSGVSKKFEAHIGSRDLGNVDPKYLSSGEKHLLSIYVPAILGVASNGYLFIDEPEISLHPRWQNDLLPNLEKLASLVNCQIFIATHSPLVLNGRYESEVEIPIGDPVNAMYSVADQGYDIGDLDAFDFFEEEEESER